MLDDDFLRFETDVVFQNQQPVIEIIRVRKRPVYEYAGSLNREEHAHQMSLTLDEFDNLLFVLSNVKANAKAAILARAKELQDKADKL